MKPLVATFLFFLTANLPALGQGDPNPSREAAIHDVVAQYAATWNSNDIRSWGELFTDDVDYVHRGGGWWRSKAENVAGHDRLHARLVNRNMEMNLDLTVESLAFLRPNIALVHVTSTWPGMGSEGERGGIMTMVMLEEDGIWRIRALQNTLASNPRPAGTGEAGS